MFFSLTFPLCQKRRLSTYELRNYLMSSAAFPRFQAFLAKKEMLRPLNKFNQRDINSAKFIGLLAGNLGYA